MINFKKQKVFSVEDCKATPRNLYVFGDNCERVGKGGQAIIRDEPNAFGIVTKRSCKECMTGNSNDLSAILLDMFELILNNRGKGTTLVFPEDGLGTGLANLQENAPHLLEFINAYIKVVDEASKVDIKEALFGNE